MYELLLYTNLLTTIIPSSHILAHKVLPLEDAAEPPQTCLKTGILGDLWPKTARSNVYKFGIMIG